MKKLSTVLALVLLMGLATSGGTLVHFPRWEKLGTHNCVAANQPGHSYRPLHRTVRVQIPRTPGPLHTVGSYWHEKMPILAPRFRRRCLDVL